MSGIQTKGKQNPEKITRNKHEQAEKAVRAKYKGKRVLALTSTQQAELLEAMMIRLGMADETGKLLP